MREVLHRAASLPALFGVGDEIDDNTQDLLVRVRSEKILGLWFFWLTSGAQDAGKGPGTESDYH